MAAATPNKVGQVANLVCHDTKVRQEFIVPSVVGVHGKRELSCTSHLDQQVTAFIQYHGVNMKFFNNVGGTGIAEPPMPPDADPIADIDVSPQTRTFRAFFVCCGRKLKESEVRWSGTKQTFHHRGCKHSVRCLVLFRQNRPFLFKKQLAVGVEEPGEG